MKTKIRYNHKTNKQIYVLNPFSAFRLAGPSPRAKMLRPIRKRPNPLNIQSNDAFNRWQRGKSTEYSIKRLISSSWERGEGI